MGLISEYLARHGAFIVRCAGQGWKALEAGTSGQKLVTKGEADPVWRTEGVQRLASVTPAMGVSGVYGAVSTISPTSGWLSLFLKAGLVVAGGIFAGGENCTAKITVHFSDSTTADLEVAFAATGTHELTPTELLSIMKTGVYVSSIGVYAKSDQAVAGGTIVATLGALNL